MISHDPHIMMYCGEICRRDALNRASVRDASVVRLGEVL
jgi:hypothetical protein